MYFIYLSRVRFYLLFFWNFPLFIHHKYYHSQIIYFADKNHNMEFLPVQILSDIAQFIVSVITEIDVELECILCKVVRYLSSHFCGWNKPHLLACRQSGTGRCTSKWRVFNRRTFTDSCLSIKYYESRHVCVHLCSPCRGIWYSEGAINT
jgi:hypothetical protein